MSRKHTWLPIASAPTDGTRIIGKAGRTIRVTWYGKTSHVPLYGWCYGRDVEDIDLWEPAQWRARMKTFPSCRKPLTKHPGLVGTRDKLRQARAAIKAMRLICHASTPKKRLAMIDRMAERALEMTE